MRTQRSRDKLKGAGIDAPGTTLHQATVQQPSSPRHSLSTSSLLTNGSRALEISSIIVRHTLAGSDNRAAANAGAGQRAAAGARGAAHRESMAHGMAARMHGSENTAGSHLAPTFGGLEALLLLLELLQLLRGVLDVGHGSCTRKRQTGSFGEQLQSSSAAGPLPLLCFPNSKLRNKISAGKAKSRDPGD